MTAASGASALPGVWSFASDRPGPHVMITGLTHGNEPAGLVAISRLLDDGVRPLQGWLTLALVNPEAHAHGRRFIDRDMNRLWRDDWLDDDRASIEAARARTLRPLLREVDALLDLHTTAFVARPFFVLADLAKHRALADHMAFPATQQLMPDGCGEGRHLTDYGAFADPAHPAVALSVECGMHDDATSGAVAIETARRFLTALGTIDGEPVPAPGPIERFRTVGACIAKTDRFELRIPTSGFVAVDKGALVALDGGEPVRAPDDLVVVSPRPTPRAGEIAFLWCEAC
jgi:predicted deacylase